MCNAAVFSFINPDGRQIPSRGGDIAPHYCGDVVLLCGWTLSTAGRPGRTALGAVKRVAWRGKAGGVPLGFVVILGFGVDHRVLELRDLPDATTLDHRK